MSLDSEIVKGLDKLALKHIHNPSLVCTVSAVSLADLTCTCTPLNGDADLLDVRLMSQSANGFLILPSVDSIVIVSSIDNRTYYVSMFSEVDEIQLNGDTYDGLVKVGDLVTKLNTIENKLNALITAIGTTWIPISNDGGAALKALIGTLTATTLSQITPTVQANIENITVKHGNGT
jgi:hypothetical protein